MLIKNLLAIAASIAAASAQYKGFNYGSTNADGTIKDQQHFTDEFNTAKNLVGASGFTSARLYTMIQGGTTNTPISAIPAAIATGTSLLLGLWASAGQADINNEIAALTAAISQYGTAFTDLIVGISVGSEDLYRVSPPGIGNESGPGAQPEDIVNYINQVRAAIASTTANGKPIGHVDTYTAWINGSNSAVVQAVDFLGTDAYPYYQGTMDNDISQASALLQSAYDQTVSAAQGKPVWITETGWPVSGPTVNQAVASSDNSQAYWDAVGCGILFGKINTWWFQLDDYPTVPTPAFGIIGTALVTTPLYNLTCPSSSGSSSAIEDSKVTSSTGSVGVMPAPSQSEPPINQIFDGHFQAPGPAPTGFADKQGESRPYSSAC